MAVDRRKIAIATAGFCTFLTLYSPQALRLPSNLQGLYRCEFEGDRLEYDATMKLLKTFSQFR